MGLILSDHTKILMFGWAPIKTTGEAKLSRINIARLKSMGN